MSVKRLGEWVFITVGNLVVKISKLVSAVLKPCKRNLPGHRLLITLKGTKDPISLTGIFLTEDAKKLNRWIMRYKRCLR